MYVQYVPVRTGKILYNLDGNWLVDSTNQNNKLSNQAKIIFMGSSEYSVYVCTYIELFKLSPFFNYPYPMTYLRTFAGPKLV